MRIYAVIDTNVLVSALLRYESVPSQVMTQALTGQIIPLLNDDILAEYAEVLAAPNFTFRPLPSRHCWKVLSGAGFLWTPGRWTSFCPTPATRYSMRSRWRPARTKMPTLQQEISNIFLFALMS